ncbi:MAG: DUF3035 domain-containing protein [Pseudomonadota bacterium]
MMRSLLLATAILPLVAACVGGSTTKRTPDEFAVITKPPLTVPPDYALRPPRPGELRPQTLSSAERTQQLLLGDRSSEPPSDGELQLIQSVGALSVDPSIRDLLNAENGSIASKNASLANRILFWRVVDGEVDDSEARLNAPDREAWFAQRQRSIESAIGEDAEVVIAKDPGGVLGLPGIR